MDIDDLLHRRRGAWDQLRELTSRASRHPARLSDVEIDDLIDGYLDTSADLAAVRSTELSPVLSSELTRLVADSSTVVYGTSARSRGAFSEFAMVQLPAAVFTMRLQVLIAAIALVLPAVLMGSFIVRDDRALPLAGSEQDIRAFVEQDFTEYYTENPNPVFAAMVGTNNIQVGALAFGAGVLGALPSLYLLSFNGLNIGVAGGIITAYGRPDIFWTSILPHGLLELSAIIVSGAAGIRLGWALLAPGDRRRSKALADEGQRAAVVMLGLVFAFTISALLEGFITPRSWSAWIEITIGAAALAAFVAPVALRGRSAATELAARRGPAGGARVVGDRVATSSVWARLRS
ncbi:MAG: putative membrane protein SpoIIM required for sporulation [Myxococcota bacterium]